MQRGRSAREGTQSLAESVESVLVSMVGRLGGVGTCGRSWDGTEPVSDG